MESDTKLFIDNVDAWIKQIRSEFSEVTDVSNVVDENVGNIQHNYELIHELRQEICDLKKELGALKLLNIIHMKEKITRKN